MALVKHIVAAGRSEALSLAAVAMWGFIFRELGQSRSRHGGGGVGAVGGGRGLPRSQSFVKVLEFGAHKREEVPGSAAFMCRVWSVCWCG